MAVGEWCEPGWLLLVRADLAGFGSGHVALEAPGARVGGSCVVWCGVVR